MSPENVTRAAEACADEMDLPTKSKWIDERGGDYCSYLSYEVRYFVIEAFESGVALGIKHQREQHREVLIRLKHILERAQAKLYPDWDIGQALAVITKELAP